MRLPTFFAAKGWMLTKLACLRISYIYSPDLYLRAIQKFTQWLDMIENILFTSKESCNIFKTKNALAYFVVLASGLVDKAMIKIAGYKRASLSST